MSSAPFRAVARAFREGRLWSPELVWLLALVLLVVNAEIDEIERVAAACNSLPETDERTADERAALIQAPCAGYPTLAICDALAGALKCPRAEARIRAGYLTEEA